VSALSSDPESRSAITALATDSSQPEEVRMAAIKSLAVAGPGAAPLLLDVAKNEQGSLGLRTQAAAALAVMIEGSGATIGKNQLDAISTELRKLQSNAALAPAAGRALKATDTARDSK
jgi:hypothetical protein